MLLLEVALAILILAITAAISWPRTSQLLAHGQQADMQTAERMLVASRRAAISSGNCKQLCIADDPLANPADCLGPAKKLYLRDCDSNRLLMKIGLQHSKARWKGLRRDIPAGFDAEGKPIAVSGSLYLCASGADSSLLQRYIVNRSGRIRPATDGGICPDF